ncbi:MAG: hypothetical protein HRT90_05500 [Candidatus Margulisbacteria bacterium]|nr:hypothetical protein [Candidatus Margulisiibacteriota bacterium]
MAYMPPTGKTEVVTSYIWETFNKHWNKSSLVSNPPYVRITQGTFIVQINHSIKDNFAIDGEFGYTSSEAASGSVSDGLSDFRLGLSYKIHDQLDSLNNSYLPSYGIRAGLIAHGDYEINQPFSAGDGGSGVEASLFFDSFLSGGWSYGGDLGYRYFSTIPDELFYGISVSKSLFTKWRVSLGVNGFSNLSGFDLGQQGTQFNQLMESRIDLDLGMTYQVSPSCFIRLGIATALSGKNTGQKQILALSGMYHF